jgi:hypothetical protein
MPCQDIPLQQIVSFSLFLIIEISIRWALDTFGLIQKRLLNYDMYLLIGNHLHVRKVCHVLIRMLWQCTFLKIKMIIKFNTKIFKISKCHCNAWIFNIILIL